MRHTEQSKLKISKNHARYWLGKKRIFSDEHKQKISNTLKGRKPIQALNVLVGKKQSSETIAKRVAKSFFEEHRQKMSIAHKGSKSHFWKGGVSMLNKTERQKIMDTFEYKNWRKSVFERDNYTCVWCGVRNGNGKAVILNADHIKSFVSFPSLRLDINNGRTLCRQCHLLTDTMGRPKRNLITII